MMRTVFLSDMHANFPALVGALQRAERLGAEAIFAAGDLIGRGPHPVETIRLLARRGIPAIRGNVETRLTTLRSKGTDFARLLKKKGSRLAWTALQLGSAEWEYLDSLPPARILTLQGMRVLIVHGSPVSETDSIYPSITAEALTKKMGGETADVLVCAHTHIPFTKTIRGIRIIGCGSVGLPVDGDPRGSLVLCDISASGKLSCRVIRFAYPVRGLIEDIKRKNVPGLDPAVFEI
jgi:putative phosphoesterase